MASIESLAKQLHSDHPEISFQASQTFSWSPDTVTVSYETSGAPEHLLHEASHALLGHTAYRRDIDLLRMEREAWEYAKNALSGRYHLPVSDEIIETALDSYRDWLHARSTCPQCSATGLQVSKDSYCCHVCNTKWRVNEARVCQLRRYTA